MNLLDHFTTELIKGLGWGCGVATVLWVVWEMIK